MAEHDKPLPYKFGTQVSLGEVTQGVQQNFQQIVQKYASKDLVDASVAVAQAAADAAQSDIDDHIADTSDAHNASAISVEDAGEELSATEVESALSEIIGMFASVPRIATGTYGTVTTTGNESITDLGFAPKLVLTMGGTTYGTDAKVAVGFFDGTNQGCMLMGVANSAQRGGFSTNMFVIADSAGTVFKSFVGVSLDADGFTFNRVVNGGATYGMHWIAIG